MFENVLSRTYRLQFLRDGRWDWATDYPVSRVEVDQLAAERRQAGVAVRIVEVLTHVLES